MKRGVLRTAEGGHLFFWCPGCKETHIVGPSWGFNGDYDRPTFTPSVLVRGNKTVKDQNGRWTGDWERDAAGNLIPEVLPLLRDGRSNPVPRRLHARHGWSDRAARSFSED